MEKVKKKRKNC